MKRKPGRPKCDLPHCLTRDPPQDEVPVAQYHPQSPDPPILVSAVTVEEREADIEDINIENIDIIVETSPLAVFPRRKKRRLKVEFLEPESDIIDRPRTRTRTRRKL